MEPIGLSVKPLAWGEWKLDGGGPLRWCTHRNGDFHHHLKELGEMTTSYRYMVSHKRSAILNVVIKLDCCCHLQQCPYIGKQVMPASPCRNSLGSKARVVAYEEWVKFVDRMVGGKQ